MTFVDPALTVPDIAGRDISEEICEGSAMRDEARFSEPVPPVFEVMSDRAGLAAAYERAQGSNDPSTQNGAVVVRRTRIIGEGCNRFARGLAETPERWERPTKYAFVAHAEVTACLSALKNEPVLSGSTLYCVWYACTDCAKVIIESGVKRVVGHANLRAFAEVHSPGWSDSIAQALCMLDEAGVACDWYTGPVDAPSIRVGGETFDPSAS